MSEESGSDDQARAVEVDREIGAQIATRRTEEKLSLAQVADDTGISKVQLQAIENGTLRPDSSQLVAIAKALGVPIVSIGAEL